MKKTILTLVTLLIMALAMSTSLMADGTEPTGNPRQVSILDHLLWISTNNSSWGDDFIQTADINASATSTWNSGAGFSPIGKTTYFFGSYDGDGHTIDGLYISGGVYRGLFGYTYCANISNLGVINVNISANTYVVGLVGWNQNGTVTNCYSTGSVNGSGFYVGGLAGVSLKGGEVTNCYSTCSVNGSSHKVGGLVGAVVYNWVTVTNCYSTGCVNGGIPGTLVGGLVGRNKCGTVSNSFWDTETSG